MSDPNRFHLVEALFHRALGRPPEERRAFVEASSDDDEVRAEVLAILAADGSDSALAVDGLSREAAPAADLAGSVVGPYKVLRLVGIGGMGEVYEAEQQFPVRRLVALKLIRAGLESGDFVARFEAERQALALMEHPGIAKILDAGTASSGRPYFVMERVEGLALVRDCDENRMGVRERIALFRDVCRAVQHAHQKGVIHRDLKPSNILVVRGDGTPRPRIIDFGIAKAIELPLTDRTLQTMLGQPIGTPEYMSPEQAGIDPRGVDTRTDVYALGVILYELLSGALPFGRSAPTPGPASLAEMIRSIREDEAVRPSSRLRPGDEATASAARRRGTEPRALIRQLRGDLDWVVMKAMEKDRDRRYASVSELVADLDRFLGDRPVLAGPPHPLYQFRRFVRRHRVAMGFASAVAIGVVVAAIGLGVGYARAVRAEHERREQLFDALVSQARAARLSPDADLGGTAMEAIEAAARLLPRLADRGDSAATLRDEAIAALALPGLTVARRFAGKPAGEMRLVFDASFDLYAAGHRDGSVTLHDAANGAEIARLDGGGAAWGEIALAPDASRVALVLTDPARSGRARLRVWSPRHPRETLEFDAVSRAGRASFSPTGDLLAYPHEDGTVRIASFRETREALRIPFGSRSSAEFSAAGNLMLWDLEGDRVRILDAGLSRARFSWRLPAAESGNVALVAESRDGSYRVVASGKQLYVFEGDADEPARVLHDPQGGFARLALHPDLPLLAASGSEGTIRLWDLETGRGVMEMRGRHPTFSEKGDLLGYHLRDEVIVRRLEASPHLVRLRAATPARPWSRTWLDFHPTRPLLACAQDDGVRLWDVARAEEAGLVPVHEPTAVAFQRDGTLWSGGSAGLERWRLREEGERIVSDRLGTEPIAVERLSGRLALSEEAATAALVVGRSAAVVLGPRGGESVRLEPHPGVLWVDVSDDGRFAATGPWNGAGVMVWDARSGERVTTLLDDPAVTRARVAFSPGGRWLATAPENLPVCLWTVGDWRPGPCDRGPVAQALPHAIAFDPVSGLLAVADAHGRRIRLLDPDRDLSPVASLESTEVEPPNHVTFSPDGAWLAVVSRASRIHLWNLRETRSRLRDLGLDWLDEDR